MKETNTDGPSAERLIEFLAAEDGMDIGVMSRDPLVEKLAAEDGIAVDVQVSHELKPSSVLPEPHERSGTAIHSEERSGQFMFGNVTSSSLLSLKQD